MLQKVSLKRATNLLPIPNNYPMKKSTLVLALFNIFLFLSCEKEKESEGGSELKIISLSPDYGKAGDEIAISGSGFSPVKTENTVTVDNKNAEVIASSASQINIKVPADASHGKVQVKTGNLTAVSSGNFFYAPEITEINPASGKAGEAVTITGKHFLANPSEMEVKFNGITAQITKATSTSLTVTVPEKVTAGKITLNHKNRPAVEGTVFTVLTDSPTTDMFTVRSGKVTASKVLETGEVFIVDDVKNILYALSADRKKIIRVDLSSNNQRVLLEGTSPFLLGNLAAPFYPTNMALSGDGNSLYLLCTTNNSTASQTNVFEVNTSNGAVSPIGSRKIGLAGIGGLTGGGQNLPFYVDNNKNVYTRHYDGSATSLQAFAKFSPDLSSYSFIIGNEFSGSSSLVRINETTFRAFYYYVFTGEHYVDITNGVASARQNHPVGASFYLISRAGNGKFGTLKRQTSGIYQLHDLNESWTSSTMRTEFVIDKTQKVNNANYTYFIDRMYMDGNRNAYVRVNLNVNENSFISDHSGIYRIKVD
jgi:hypothetical protein